MKTGIGITNTNLQRVVSSNFFIGLMESHEKMAWFLHSHLK